MGRRIPNRLIEVKVIIRGEDENNELFFKLDTKDENDIRVRGMKSRI